MKLSNFFYYLPVDNNHYAIYNSLLMDILFVDKNTLTSILNNIDIDDNTKDRLYKAKIIVKSDEEDEEAYNRLYRSIIGDSKKISVLYLIVSSYCNLACTYCFINNNPLSTNMEELMSKETVEIAIKKFISETERNGTSENAQIIIYGGEPFANPETLVHAIKCIRNLNKTLEISIVSNGTMLTEELIQVLKENNVGLGISIDGPKYINDKNRLFRTGSSSVYDSLKENIDLLKKLNANFGLSVTITKDVINHKDEIINWLFDLDVKNVFWNLYHYSEPDIEWEQHYDEMAKFIFETYDVLDGNGFSNDKLTELITLFINKNFRRQGCAAIGFNQLTIQPNGDICVCHGDSRSSKYVIGNIIDDDIPAILEKTNNTVWEKCYTILHDECKHCHALFICGGGCPVQSEALFGNRVEIDHASCIFYKHFLSWILRKYYYLSTQ